MWPFKSERRQAEPETRQAVQDYTQAIVDRILALHTPGQVDVGMTAAAAAAAGVISRSFAAATVAPSVDRTGLTPAVLAEIGAALVYAGESVWLIDVTEAGVQLLRASSWDVTGDGPRNWRYRLSLSGPSGTLERVAPEAGVFHPRANVHAAEPHRGRSALALAGASAEGAAHGRRPGCLPPPPTPPAAEPHRGRSALALAGASAEGLANAERQLSEELSGPVGRLIPAPLDQLEGEGGEGDPDPLAELEATLAQLKGRSALVPSMQREWTGQTGGPSQGDWTSKRIGADPPASVVQLRKDGHNAVLSAAGVPPMMFSEGGQAQASREALRQFLHMTVAPLARLVETEASSKLGVPVQLDFTALHASDVQGRARSFQSLVGGGMDVERAARLSGLLVDDDGE